MEGMQEGSWERQKGAIDRNPDFHLDPNKVVDPVEELVEKLGPNRAFDELADQLPPDTDPEIVRKMKLVLNQVIKKSQH